eukprot:6464331-Amphidinium_carterae.2
MEYFLLEWQTWPYHSGLPHVMCYDSFNNSWTLGNKKSSKRLAMLPYHSLSCGRQCNLPFSLASHQGPMLVPAPQTFPAKRWEDLLNSPKIAIKIVVL